MFKAVMFDLDGTLIDTAGEIADTINDVLRDLALSGVSEEAVRRWIGRGSRELLCRALAQATGLEEAGVRESGGLDAALAMYVRNHARRCGTRSWPYPAVGATLSVLSARGVALAVVSNRERHFVEAVLDAHGLLQHFDCIVAGDTLAARKPDPAPLLHCLHQLGVAPAHALMVGDSALDVEAARRAGVVCWAVPYGYNEGQPIARAKPDRVIADIGLLAVEFRKFRDRLRLGAVSG